MKKSIILVSSLLCLILALAGCARTPIDSIVTPAHAAETTAAQYPIATTEDVVSALKDGSAVVIDARSASAYSGWATGENKLGGHIDGAVDYSANWLTCGYDEQNNYEQMTRLDLLRKYMLDKNISPESAVIVYDENGKDALAVADFLGSEGLTSIRTYSLSDWTNPLKKFANYELWVPASVVNDLISSTPVPEINVTGKPVILEVSWGKENESGYLNGHVPGALHVNSDDFDDENNLYLLESDDVLLNQALSLGITSSSTVIVTGDGIFACRYGVILRYLGVENVYVMSGGNSAWTDAGYTLETNGNTATPAADFGIAAPAHSEYIDTTAEVQQQLSQASFTLVDNRTWEEYIGETSGYSYLDKAGRIEGAVYGFAGINNSSSMFYYRNIDNTMRNPDEILAMWTDAGIDTTKHLSFMCGGGYRAAEVLWDAWVMGLTDVSLFADGWTGWELQGLPTVTGE
jgi:thiosulfate/3-mercaptopyruvate sulfurtransferase